MMRRKTWCLTLALIAWTGLSACGGGGSAPPAPPPPPPPPPPPSSDASLSDLGLRFGTLDQTFQTTVFDYTATVGYIQTSASVVAETTHPAASVSVNGINVPSGSVADSVNLLVGQNILSIIVTAEDGVTSQTYAIAVSREAENTFAQRAYIKASNPDSQDYFGYSVSLYDDTLAVGAYYEASSANGVNGSQFDNSEYQAGAVYIFSRDMAGTWTQEAYLKASNSSAGDLFGFSIDLDENQLAVSGLFEESSATGINGDQTNDNAPDSGAVYLFSRDVNGLWAQDGYIKASNADAGDRFGWSVALSGDSLLVGAPHESSASTGINGNQLDNSSGTAGAVYSFRKSNTGTWNQDAYIKASNSGPSDQFGYSLSLSGNTLAVGSLAPGSGAVYVFVRDGSGSWLQQAYIKSSNPDPGDSFGRAVSLAGDTLAVGAVGEDSTATGVDGDQLDNNFGSSGAVYVFTRDESAVWSQQAYLKASNTDPGDRFGWSIDLSDNMLAVYAQWEASLSTGINGDQSNTTDRAGAVYVFERDSGGNWMQRYYTKASNTDPDDEFGWSLSISGDTLAAGSQFEDSSASGIDGDQADNSAFAAGAVYVFE